MIPDSRISPELRYADAQGLSSLVTVCHPLLMGCNKVSIQYADERYITDLFRFLAYSSFRNTRIEGELVPEGGTSFPKGALRFPRGPWPLGMTSSDQPSPPRPTGSSRPFAQSASRLLLHSFSRSCPTSDIALPCSHPTHGLLSSHCRLIF